MFVIYSNVPKQEGFHDYSKELKGRCLASTNSCNRTELLREFGINVHQVCIVVRSVLAEPSSTKGYEKTPTVSYKTWCYNCVWPLTAIEDLLSEVNVTTLKSNLPDIFSLQARFTCPTACSPNWKATDRSVWSGFVSVRVQVRISAAQTATQVFLRLSRYNLARYFEIYHDRLLPNPYLPIIFLFQWTIYVVFC